MKAAKQILKILNSLVDFAVILALLISGFFSAYALWDNHLVYSAAENVQRQMLELKPDEASGSISFEQLLSTNPDVCAWISLDRTKIDYPVLQGTDNLSYLNTDVYGNFALAGSIFLDSHSDRAFQDDFSLLYGHHMENSKMFGDLDLYKEAGFFYNNHSGILILPDRTCDLEIFACLLVPASEKMIFEPEQREVEELLDFVRGNSLHMRTEMIDRITASEIPPQILGLSTCSSEFTDARTVVLAVMEPCASEI